MVAAADARGTHTIYWCGDTWGVFGHGHVQGWEARHSAPTASPWCKIGNKRGREPNSKKNHWSCTKAGKSYLATDLEGRCWSFPFKRILSGTWNIGSIEDWKLAFAVLDCWFPPTCIPYICPPASSTMCGSPLREVAGKEECYKCFGFKHSSGLNITVGCQFVAFSCASNILA